LKPGRPSGPGPSGVFYADGCTRSYAEVRGGARKRTAGPRFVPAGGGEAAGAAAGARERTYQVGGFYFFYLEMGLETPAGGGWRGLPRLVPRVHGVNGIDEPLRGDSYCVDKHRRPAPLKHGTHPGAGSVPQGQKESTGRGQRGGIEGNPTRRRPSGPGRAAEPLAGPKTDPRRRCCRVGAGRPVPCRFGACWYCLARLSLRSKPPGGDQDEWAWTGSATGMLVSRVLTRHRGYPGRPVVTRSGSAGELKPHRQTASRRAARPRSPGGERGTPRRLKQSGGPRQGG